MSGSKEAENEENKGFTVVDRRASAGAADSQEQPPSRKPSAPDQAAPRATPPTFDFSMLVQSVAITAMHHLGLVPDPATGARGEPNLALARQNIEILEILQRKTQGNLDDAEAHLLSSLLYEVRMHFVEATKPQSR